MNKKLFFQLLIINIFLTVSISAYTQISKGGTPPSFSVSSLEDSVYTFQTPQVNIDSLLTVDSLESINEKIFRFGHAIDVDMGLNNSGTWDTLQNGDKIWRLKITSPSAFSINLIYDDFWLPDGAQFFVYSEDKTMILGAFTPEVSNNDYYQFSTDLVKGDAIVLEYYEPSYANGGKINVSKVIHGFKDMFKSGHGGSGSCNNDITCSQGNEWCVEKRAVSMILTDNNTQVCSGCLINNVREDLTPYYLTANHCMIGNESTWIFRFKYWSQTCNQGHDANHWVSISGSTKRSTHSNTDFALLELNSSPPSGFGVLYAGWDRMSLPATNTIGIHHPSQDVMKISFDNSIPLSSDYEPAPISPNSYWKVIWDIGTTEGGSSGSPLFNQNHRIVGQLRGGLASCSKPIDPDFYGRFDVSWNGGGTPETRLRDWLDPDNTGVTTVGPTSPTIFLINRTLTETHKFAALEDIHIEGNVSSAGFPCPSFAPFTAESGSNVDFKAKKIVVKSGTYFKQGSIVNLLGSSQINCEDNIVEGNFVDAFCHADISKTIVYDKELYDQSEKERITKKDKKSNFIIYPNPTSGNFTVETNKPNSTESIDISVYDQLGRKVHQKPNAGSIEQLDLTEQGKGVYFIKIQVGNEFFNKKLVVQ